MAAVDTSGVAEIAASLTMEDVPIKLRCAGCNKLAVNAFRTPCCEQSICETCQVNLPQACPICLHEPVKAEDCKLHKTLRTTIKAFLRKKGMEREALKKKENAAKTPATPATAETPPLHQIRIQEDGGAAIKESLSEMPQAPSEFSTQIGAEIRRTPSESQVDIPRPSIESAIDTVQPETSNGIAERAAPESDKVDGDGRQDARQEPIGKHPEQNGQWESNGDIGQGGPNGNFPFGAMSGGFPNIGINGTPDFNQMMPFMANGMPNNLMGTFPNMMNMSGMPGMGMDPMSMSQGMYAAFGGQGMDMNGMNMGMGFDAGQGGFGGFNGQTWNSGQDKFNPNAYGSHANGMGGDFGAHGYGGYNIPSHQGNFNQMHHQQFPHNDFQNGYNGHGFQNRGRGRRGAYANAGRGRGNYNQVVQGNQANHEPFHHQIPPQSSQQSTQQTTRPEPQTALVEQKPMGEEKANEKQKDEEADQASENQPSKEPNPADTNEKPADDVAPLKRSVSEAEPASGQEGSTAESRNESFPTAQEAVAPEPVKETRLAPIQTYISSEQPLSAEQPASAKSTTMPPPESTVPLGPASQYSQDQSLDFGGRGRGSIRGHYRGAPGHRGRGYGFYPNGNTPNVPSQSNPTSECPPVAPVEPKGLGVEGAPKGPKAMREGLPNTSLRGGRGFSIVGRASASVHPRSNGIARSRSRSRSRHGSRSRSKSPSTSRHRSRHHRSHRHRSESASEGSDRERRRERHRRRSRRYDDETGRDHDRDGSRARDDSADSYKRSSHRNSRNHEKDSASGRHRHRRDRSRDHHDERGYRRKRSRSPTADVNGKPAGVPPSPSSSKHKEKDDLRKRREREEDDRDHDHKRSRREDSGSPEDGHRSARRSKHDRDGKETASSETKKTENPSTPKEAEKDHHTLEREARNRERLLKELQRREAMEGKGPKRRDSKADGRVGGRRMSYKYEDEESDEARTMRIESEREAGRWG